MYLSISKHNLPIKNKGKKQDYTREKIEIEKKKRRLLEKKIKNVRAKLKNLGIS